MSTLDKFRYLDVVWSPAEFHENLIGCLDESYVAACRDERFGEQHGVTGAPTFWQQTPLLGHSKLAREPSGLCRFAKRYLAAEGQGSGNSIDRWSFDRLGDFVLYSKHNPKEGKKRPLLLAEVRPDPAELLTALANLLTIRAPYKYLFVATPSSTLDRLNAYCAPAEASGITDWPGTIIHIIEIPTDQCPPSAWNTLQATANDSGQLQFKPLT